MVGTPDGTQRAPRSMRAYCITSGKPLLRLLSGCVVNLELHSRAGVSVARCMCSAGTRKSYNRLPGYCPVPPHRVPPHPDLAASHVSHLSSLISHTPLTQCRYSLNYKGYPEKYVCFASLSEKDGT